MADVPENLQQGELSAMQADGEEISILALLKELETVRDESTEFYLTCAMNERYVNGDQYIAVNNGEIVDDEDWDDNVPKLQRNLLPNLSLTWEARINEDRPDGVAYPAEAGADVGKANVANKVLLYQHQRHDFDKLMSRAGMLVQPHTEVGFKVVWDGADGPVDTVGYPRLDDLGREGLDDLGNPVMEGIGERLGEIAWQVVPTFDYWTDGAEDIEDSDWVVFTSHMTKWDARALFAKHGVDGEPNEKEYENRQGLKRKGVETFEVWFRPGNRFKTGLYAVVCGGVAVLKRDFPYDHGMLPIAIWKCGDLSDSAHGTSHINNALPIQRALNEAVGAMARQVRTIGGIRAFVLDSVKGQVTQGHDLIGVPTLEGGAPMIYVVPPNLMAPVKEHAEDCERSLYAVFGLSDTLTGTQSVTGEIAARSIAFLQKLAKDKQNAASRWQQAMVVRVMRMTLRLVQQFVRAPRLIQMVGKQNTVDAFDFLGADLTGFDIRLEPRGGLERLAATAAADAQQQGQAGTLAPAAAAERSQTGLPETVMQGQQRERLNDLVMAILHGQQVQPDPAIEPEVAVAELGRLVAAHPQLRPLLDAYQQMAAQRAAQSTNAQGMGPGPRGGAAPTP